MSTHVFCLRNFCQKGQLTKVQDSFFASLHQFSIEYPALNGNAMLSQNSCSQQTVIDVAEIIMRYQYHRQLPSFEEIKILTRRYGHGQAWAPATHGRFGWPPSSPVCLDWDSCRSRTRQQNRHMQHNCLPLNLVIDNIHGSNCHKDIRDTNEQP